MLYFKPSKIKLIKFIFIPTTLSDDHKCLVSFKSPHIGCWSVKLTGSGVPPSAFDTTRIATTLNKPVTVMLPFRNPAEEVAHISIELIDIENETNARSGSEILRSVTPNKTLQLLLKRQERIALSPNEVVDIPIRNLILKIVGPPWSDTSVDPWPDNLSQNRY